MPYCIYTDREVPIEDGSPDHVIPLALGGRNGFEVWSEGKVNSDLGSQVEGKLQRDPLLVFALRDAGVVGHSRKPTVPVWRKVDLAGRPIQVTLDSDKITAWDARERRELTEEEFSGQSMTAELKLDAHVTTRFLAKIALGTGYFAYGDPFRAAVDCGPLRELALLDLAGARQSQKIMSSEIAICDRFHPDSQPGREGYLYRVLMESTNRSMVICIPHHAAISFHVGLVGVFIGTIICPAVTDALPLDGDHDLGHAICLAPGDFERLSFRELLRDFYRNVIGEEPPSPAE